MKEESDSPRQQLVVRGASYDGFVNEFEQALFAITSVKGISMDLSNGSALATSAAYVLDINRALECEVFSAFLSEKGQE